VSYTKKYNTPSYPPFAAHPIVLFVQSLEFWLATSLCAKHPLLEAWLLYKLSACMLSIDLLFILT